MPESCARLYELPGLTVDASCLTAGGLDFEFAVRDIEVGEELCDDYGTLNPMETFACSCGSSACRRSVGPDDTARLIEAWDARIRGVFLAIGAVAQPLMPLVAERDRLERALRDPAQIPSCRDHFGPTLARAR